jgi:hypothetical protein
MGPSPMNEYRTLFERAGARFEDPALSLAGVLRRRNRKRMRRRIGAILAAGIVIGLVAGAAVTGYLRASPELLPTAGDMSRGHPVESPNGSHTAFVFAGGIWVSNPDGSAPVRVAPGYEFAWSRDGNRIATHVESGGAPTSPHGPSTPTFHEEIWVVSVGGSDPVSILPPDCCPGGILDDSLRWSTDGSRIAFWPGDSLRVNDGIRVAMADGSDARRSLADLPSIDVAEWRNWWK